MTELFKGPYKPSYFITITSVKTKFKRFMRQNKTSCLENRIQFEIALILENDLKAVGIVKDNVFRFAVFFSMFVVFASKYVDKIL